MDKRDPFDLAQLPTEPAPADLWQGIEARLAPPRRARWPLALAASVLVVVLVGLLWQSAEVPTSPSTVDLLAAQQQRSADLEDRLDQVLGGPVGLGVIAEAGVLEAALEQVDEELAWNPTQPSLWTERVRLLEALVGLYATEIWLAQADLARL